MIRNGWFDTPLTTLPASEASVETEDEKIIMNMLASVFYEDITIEGEKNEEKQERDRSAGRQSFPDGR